jgi:hypothetical protein
MSRLRLSVFFRGATVTQAELVQQDYWTARLSDGGPRYVETNLDRVIREPCNAATAFIFVLIAAIFVVRMRGRFRQHPFICFCMPLLLAGGIGGTIYHALRRHEIFLYLDFVPILLLVASGSIYLGIRLKPRMTQVIGLAALIAIFAALVYYFFSIGERQIAIEIQYLALAVLVLLPVALVLRRTNYRHFQIIKLALVCFGFAFLFRSLDPVSAPFLPIGTHWLWHILGAATTYLLSDYFYRIETETIPTAIAPEIPSRPVG